MPQPPAARRPQTLPAHINGASTPAHAPPPPHRLLLLLHPLRLPLCPPLHSIRSRPIQARPRPIPAHVRPKHPAPATTHPSLFSSTRYVLADKYVGNDFFNHWAWESIDDPTHGRVNYVSKSSAHRANLSFASETKFVMRADHTARVAPAARGRDSVRIHSNKAYGDSVAILDVEHMPEGCATWPAFWSLSQAGPWPAGGEIDIIEGVNLQAANTMSLHTLPVCVMPAGGAPRRAHTGTVLSTDCDARANYNQGCGVRGPPASYGAPLNAARGGWFVVARGPGPEGVRGWFWARADPAVPPEVRDADGDAAAAAEVRPGPAWGLPVAHFPMGRECEYAPHFDEHMFVFDLTFCGDWAGNAYPTSGCGGSCVDLVDNHPEAFVDAYWEVNSLRVYTPAR
ncbi:glycoside hydrolase family 16 protein [Daedalea quercina L-15889]|uniref:Glycoside hydrolase family 16 protein n=1 Tax=Daedalea quercina L-15889 TaxID=1314783 RepID=A0A165N1U3_9APHY|nr:glycoside hydrolase family 16 protein [Daedalea quercina L-15889]